MRKSFAAIAAFAGGIRRRLAARADREHEMSLNRLLFVMLMTGYLLIDPVRHESEAIAVMGVGLVLVIGIFLHILRYPAPNNGRRIFAAAADLMTISFQIHAGGDTGAVFYPLLLWTVLGNGFRFGTRWLAISGTIAFLCFAAVIATTPFWQNHIPLCVGLGAGLLMIPAYTGSLIRKLDSARQQAEVANNAKTMFLAAVSHQLRTPLNAIIGAQSTLLATALDPAQQEMSRIARQAARLLLTSIDELLDFSEVEAGSVRLHPVDFDLLDLLADVIGLFRASAAEKSIRLTLYVAVECRLSLRGEQRYLRDILQNLIGNAVKFTRRGGVLIAVRSDALSGAACVLTIEVTDTGIGIAPTSLGHIFDSFRQADHTILHEFGGTGLGLAISQRLAAALAGNIEVSSRLGEGSTFRFQGRFDRLDRPQENTALPQFHLRDATGAVQARLAIVAPNELRRMGRSERGDFLLPVAVSSVANADTQQLTTILVGNADPAGDRDPRWYCTTRIPFQFSHAQWMAAMAIAHRVATGLTDSRDLPASKASAFRRTARRLRVLVVEDNLLNQRVLTRMLELAGHQVTVAPDGEAALDLIESRSPDIALMDINMPNLNGIDATRLYRAASLDLPHLPIIGLTANASKEQHRSCMAAGMDALLTKPVDLDALIDILERLAPAPSASAQGRSGNGPAAPSAPQTPEEQQPSLLDEVKLQRLVELDGEDFMYQMIRLFFKQTEIARRDLRNAFRQHDVPRLRDLAHSLLSSAVNVGADQLAIEAVRLQHAPTDVLVQSEAAALDPVLGAITAVQAAITLRLPP